MKKTFWARDWFFGLAVTVGLLAAAGTGPVRSLEWALYDLGVRFSAERTPTPDISVVAIDDASLEAFGPWPWSRHRIASALRRLRSAGAVGLVLPLASHENRAALEFIGQIEKKYKGRSYRNLFASVRSGLDADRALASSMRRAGNVILGAGSSDAFAGDNGDRRELQLLPDIGPTPLHWWQYLPSVLPAEPASAERLNVPLGAFLKSASGVGYLNTAQWRSRSRAQPLAIHLGERGVVPSFALLMVAEQLGVRGGKLSISAEEGVSLAGRRFAADHALHAYPYFYPGPNAFRQYSIRDLLNGKVPSSRFANKLVLVGPTSPRITKPVALPDGEAVAPVVATAHVISGLLQGDLYNVPSWAPFAQFGLLIAVGLYLVLVLPRFRLTSGLILSLLVLFILLNTHFILMIARSTWVPLAVPLGGLILGHGFLAMKRVIEDRFSAYRADLSESNRLLGQLYQAQGQLDQAFARYQLCLKSDEPLEQLYALGLDYERKRQFNKAVRVFEEIMRSRRKFRDVSDRIRRNREMEGMLVLGKGASGPSETLILPSEGLQKPMLGRYQLERELGRGAMGLVYLGRDPKIGRTVAIKTMALTQEFEPEQLKEVRERFFREAETAGRLNHPNIVTIYDVGEEQDLAYIAMDYLKGESLSAYCKNENLLSTGQVLQIGIQVAEALDYAHKQNVVHRDIKPANIVYDAEVETVKVTDFGVACLTDSSKTRTGTILGSPSYMSPEQLAGNGLDGRADLFSLGITLFQLLTGTLPFQADSLATLMFKITHERQPDPRKLRTDLPESVVRIINRALQKDMERRYQSGQHMAEALRKCQRKLG